MSFNAPSPPDPNATAAAQAKYNKEAAISQAYLNNTNQVTPYGSQSYQQTGTAPDGTPTFTSTQQLNPAEQQLFDTTVGTQGKIAGAAGQLADNIMPSLTNAPDLSNDSLVKTLMGWQQDYMQPIWNQQQSNLDSKLANQGITQGSQAWNNAQNLQARNVGNVQEGALAQFVPEAFNQAVTKYQLPIQTLATLLGEGSPANMTQSLTQTPQEQIQPPNYQGLVEQNYQQQLAQNQNMMSGLFAIPTALAGGWARAGGIGALSDRRAKKDVVRIGWLNDGTPVYRFRYLDDPRMTIGVMAQDIMDENPDAVMVGENGFLMVDYEKATDRSAWNALHVQ